MSCLELCDANERLQENSGGKTKHVKIFVGIYGIYCKTQQDSNL